MSRAGDLRSSQLACASSTTGTSADAVSGSGSALSASRAAATASATASAAWRRRNAQAMAARSDEKRQVEGKKARKCGHRIRWNAMERRPCNRPAERGIRAVGVAYDVREGRRLRWRLRLRLRLRFRFRFRLQEGQAECVLLLA
eukprot:scaffold2538_cov235-Pinguiococcus_pyrenoidosus.AAC.5